MKRLWLVIAGTYVVSLAIDMALDAKYLGVYPLFGLVGCIVTIVVSKWLGKVWLQRPDPQIVSADVDSHGRPFGA